VWPPLKLPTDGQGCRWPLDGLYRLGFLAGRKLDEKAAVEFVGAFPHGRADTAYLTKTLRSPAKGTKCDSLTPPGLEVKTRPTE